MASCLQKALYALIILATPIFGHIIPTPTIHANLPLKHDFVPTPTSNVPNLLGQRSVEHFCLDSCAQWLNGDSQSVKNEFVRDCSSYLSTRIGSTVVT